MSELRVHHEALSRELSALEAEAERLRDELGGEAARSLRDQLALVEAEVRSLIAEADAAEAALDARLASPG